MAKKFSTNTIPDGNYSADWGNDQQHSTDAENTGLPYSGESVQKFIKDELLKKLEQNDVEDEVSKQVGSTFFNEKETVANNGSGSKVITSLEGNADSLTYTYKVKNPDGTITTRTKTLDISTVDVNDRFIRITSQLSNSYINVGGDVNFYYGFAITDYEGKVIENQFATAVLNLYRQGSPTPFQTINLGLVQGALAVGSTTLTVSLTSILKQYVSSSANIIATISLAHTYSYVDAEELTVSRTINGQSSNTVTVIALTLSTGINIATNYQSGLVSIPYTIKGNGTKSITLYKNGVLVDSVTGISSANTSSTFTLSISQGRTNYQMVAEAVAGNTSVQSTSYYFDLAVPASGANINFMFEDTFGEIRDSSSYLIPTLKTAIYETFSMLYYVYNSTSTTTPLVIVVEELGSDNQVLSTSRSEQTVGRQLYTFSKRIKTSNKYKVTFTAGTSTRTFYIQPQVGSVDINLPTEGLVLNLDADGRSNEETNPAIWNYGNYSTKFEGVNWDTDGWVLDEGSTALLLQNGAKATINFPLFAAINNMAAALNNGCTFEILLKTKNLSTDTTPIVKCLWLNGTKNIGLNITPTYLGVNTGDQRLLPSDDEEAEALYEDVSVGQTFSEGTYYKYTFVIDKYVSKTSLYKAYINGELSYAAPINSENELINLNKVPIVIDSTAGDVYIKSIKYYNTALTHDNCVDSFTVDQTSVADIEALYEKNDIYGEDNYGNPYVSPEKLLALGQGVMILSPSIYQTTPELLSDVNAITNKKSKGFVFRIDYFAPSHELRLDGGTGKGDEKGTAFNFTHLGCDVTILGTTSALRPRKNYRININKNLLSQATITVDGVQKTPYKDTTGNAYKGDFYVNGKNSGDAGKFKYKITPNNEAVYRFCLKADFVDSSMTHNTGGALMFNELTRAINSIQNPAQIKERTENGTIHTRVAIEGFPINVFEASAVADVIKYVPATELSDSNYTGLKYFGQYNFNNDKSKTGALFGFDGAYKYDVGVKSTSGSATAVPQTGWYLNVTTGLVSKVKGADGTWVALGVLDAGSYSSIVAGDTPVYSVTGWSASASADATGTLVAEATKEGNIFGGTLVTKAGLTCTLKTQKLFDETTTTGNYNAKGNAEAICMEFLNNTLPLNAFWTKFNADGTISDENWETPFKAGLCYELRAPAVLTDFVSADDQGDYKKVSKVTGGLSMLTLTNEWIKDAQDKAGTRGDANIEDYRWIKGCIQRLFTFVGTCAKEVAIKNGKTIAQLNLMIATEDVKSTTAFDSWDWSNTTFANNASKYFNMDNVCAWYLWTDYLLAVDQRNKNLMIYTMDGLHWMFLFYDGDTVLGESNDCALAYDYLTTKDTFDSSRGQFAFQGHSNWLWYLVRANFASLLKSMCDTMRKSSRFSPQYIKEVFNNQIVGSWNQRLINLSEQYRYIDQLVDTTAPDGTKITTGNEAYLNTVQGSRLAHRNYMLDNRFAMLDAYYQTLTWMEDATTCNLAGTAKIVSKIPYTFGFGRSSRGIDASISTTRDNDYQGTLTLSGGSANEPIIMYGLSRATEITLRGALQSESTANPAKFTSSVLQKLDMAGITSGTYLGLEGTSSLTYLYIQNSSIATISGLLECKKLKEFNALNTNFTSFLVADGCQIESIKLNKPTQLILSNLSNIKFTGAADDNLVVTSWANTERLVLNGCEGVDINYLLDKFATSTAAQKAIRLLNINMTISSITWLDLFDGMYGLTRNGVGAYSLDTSGPSISGTVTLSDYTDDATVEEYRAKFPDLSIKQPEFTMIRAAEVASSASIVNVDNNTGYGTGSAYTPSGHILNILNRVHRYLGKVTQQGSRVELVGNPNDSDTWGQKFFGRDTDGNMTLILLSDENSNYYAHGYNAQSTRKLADLSGSEGKGEVGVLIPGFWYKGINFHTPQNSGYKYNFTCYSSQTDRPTTSSEIKAISIAALKEQEATTANLNDGLYASGYFVYASTSDSYSTILSRLNSSSYCDVFRVKVLGYKKIQYPVSVNCACVFTDADGKVLTSTKSDGTTGIVNGYGLLLVGSTNLTLNGMPMISTIPQGAVYFFMSVKRNNVATTTGSGSVTPEYCDVVLHKGSKFASGDAMTLENAKEWLADMEPNWVYSDPVFIHAAECVAYNNGQGNTLYTPFNGTKTGTKGSGNTAQYLDPGIVQEYNQYYFRYLAEQRGLLLIDYEASKLIAMLFYAKYGTKNSQEQLGGGTATNARYLGATASIGMQDTICRNLTTGAYLGSATLDSVVYNAYSYAQSALGTYTYSAIGSPNFLGIENVQGNLYEWMDKVYYANETAANCGKLRITMPNGSTRRVLSQVPSGNYPISVVHGRYCDIASCGITAGNNMQGYSDYQSTDTTQRSRWIDTHAVGRSYSNANAGGGVSYLNGGYSVAYASPYLGSRLIFRGNFNIVNNISDFENALEDRSLAGD